MRPHLAGLAALMLALAGCGGSGSNPVHIPRTAGKRCRSAASQYQKFEQDLGPVLKDPSARPASDRAQADAESLKTTLAAFVAHANVDQQAALSQYRGQLRDFQLQLTAAAGGSVTTPKQVIAGIARGLTGLKPLLEALCKG